MVWRYRENTCSPSVKQLLNAGRLMGETRLELTPRKVVMLSRMLSAWLHPRVRSEILTITVESRMLCVPVRRCYRLGVLGAAPADLVLLTLLQALTELTTL